MENNSFHNLTGQEKIIPWEKRKEIGFLKAFLFTIKRVIFSPKKFFSQITTEGKIKEPLLFGIIVSVLIIFLWFLSLQLCLLVFPYSPTAEEQYFLKICTSPLLPLLSPLISMAGLFIATVIFHIGLRLVGARRGPGQHLKYAYWTGTRWKIETVERQRLGWSTHYVEKLPC